VIDALLSKDAKTIRPLIVFTSVPCTTDVGMGGPPKCPQGQTDGHLVDVFLYSTCEGATRLQGPRTASHRAWRNSRCTPSTACRPASATPANRSQR
jgi:hypothetical protein